MNFYYYWVKKLVLKKYTADFGFINDKEQHLKESQLYKEEIET